MKQSTMVLLSELMKSNIVEENLDEIVEDRRNCKNCFEMF